MNASIHRVVATAGLAACLVARASWADEWPSARLGDRAHWDAAYDAASAQRFIPTQLVVPGVWGGARTADSPPGNFIDGGGDRWSGPTDDAEPLTGRKILSYGRERTNRREGTVVQRFALREQGDGIGRIRDSRFGGLECAGEIKFPLGLWREGETRRNEYHCAIKGGPPERRVNTITIEKIDFPCRGVPHCLQFTWTHESERLGKLDDRRYVFAPGIGEFVAERR